MSLAFTKQFLATSESQMLLGRDGERTELTIINTSDDEFIYLGFGNPNITFITDDCLPLAPGEAYDTAETILNAVYVMTNGPDVPISTYWASRSPGYVIGVLIDG